MIAQKLTYRMMPKKNPPMHDLSETRGNITSFFKPNFFRFWTEGQQEGYFQHIASSAGQTT